MTTADDLKYGLRHIADRLAELETAARKLENQNFADIVKSAKGRTEQLLDHPDLSLVHAEMAKEHDDRQAPFQFDAGSAAAEFLADGSPNPEYKAS